jgi:hypothetical protein
MNEANSQKWPLLQVTFLMMNQPENGFKCSNDSSLSVKRFGHLLIKPKNLSAKPLSV